MSMKHTKLLLLPALMVSLSLSSCGQQEGDTDKRPIMTYGSYIEYKPNTLKVLSNDELYNRLYNENEVMLLAVYQGDYSEDCACWTTFKNIICMMTKYVHYQVYLFNAQTQDDSVKELKIKKVAGSTPMFYIFNGKKQLACFSEANKRDKELFEYSANAYTELAGRIGQYVQPYSYLYYVNEESLDKLIAEQYVRRVFFIRSKCSDCKYTINNVLMPYLEDCYNRNYLINSCYVFDMQPYYDYQKNNEFDEPVYSNLKEKYHLSSKTDEEFGYYQGVVPTAQKYWGGELISASVFFNDVVSKDENDDYYISDSYYTEERLPYLDYLSENHAGDSIEHKVLKGMKLDKDDVLFTNNGTPYWAQEKAAEYHTPLLKAFLE